MAEKIRIIDLPVNKSISKNDMLVETNGFNTYKITIDDLINYISSNSSSSEDYIKQSDKGIANGVVPLNANKKISGEYVTYGTTTNTAYEGSAGKILETNLDNHLTDSNAHGFSTTISTHNESNLSHNDIRVLITELTTRLNALADSDDTTLDQLSEIVTYIKSNKSLIDSITTNKANSSDLASHVSDANKHVNNTEKTNWNLAKTHADSAHAPSNAEANQNAFSNVLVGSTTIAADSKTDTLTLVGNNVTLTPDATNDKVTIGITKENVESALGYTPGTSSTDTNTTYTLSKVNGKIILTGSDGSETSAEDSNTVYTHPTTSGNKHIPSGGSSGQLLKWLSDGTAVWGDKELIAQLEPSGQATDDYWLLDY